MLNGICQTQKTTFAKNEREEGKAIVLIGKQNNNTQFTEEEIENSYEQEKKNVWPQC